MTPEQKQKLAQVIKRHNQQPPSTSTVTCWNDVDFLLSLVKSQEARAFPDPRHWEPVGPPVVLPAPLLPHSYEEYVLGFCPEKGRGNAILSVEGELTLLGKNVVRELSNRVATSMRSTCVEKAREVRQQLVTEAGPESYSVGAATRIIAALESLSIEKPKE